MSTHRPLRWQKLLSATALAVATLPLSCMSTKTGNQGGNKPRTDFGQFLPSPSEEIGTAAVGETPTPVDPDLARVQPIRLATPECQAIIDAGGVFVVSNAGNWLLFDRGPVTQVRQREDGVVERVGNDGTVELYEPRANGLEQSFLIPEPPQGSFVVDATPCSDLPGRLCASGDAVIFGDQFLYSSAVALDARGVRLPLPIQYSQGRVRLEIPSAWLATASYPVVLDPVIGNPQIVALNDQAISTREPGWMDYSVAYNSLLGGVGGYIRTYCQNDNTVLPDNPNRRKVFYQQLSGDGQPMAAIRVRDEDFRYQDGPQVAIATGRNISLIVYGESKRGSDATGKSAIQAVLVRGNRLPFGPITIDNSLFWNENPAIAYSQRLEKFLVVWNRKAMNVDGTPSSQPGQIYAGFVNLRGEVDPASPRPLSMSTNVGRNVRVDCVGNGFVVAYLCQGLPAQVEAFFVGEDLSPLRDPIQIDMTPMPSMFTVGSVAVAAGPLGEALVVYACMIVVPGTTCSLRTEIRSQLVHLNGGAPVNNQCVAEYCAVKGNDVTMEGQHIKHHTAEVCYSPTAQTYLALATISHDLSPRGMDVRSWRIDRCGVLDNDRMSNPYDLISSGFLNRPEGFCVAGPSNEVMVVGTEEIRRLNIGPPAVGFSANRPPHPPTDLTFYRESDDLCIEKALPYIEAGDNVYVRVSVSDPDNDEPGLSVQHLRAEGERSDGLQDLPRELTEVVSSLTTGADKPRLVWDPITDPMNLVLDRVSPVTENLTTFSFRVRAGDEHGLKSDWVQRSLSLKLVQFTERGDADGNGRIQALNDALFILGYVFNNAPGPAYLQQADIDENCNVGLNDGICLLSFGFAGGPPPRTYEGMPTPLWKHRGPNPPDCVPSPTP